MLAAPRHTMRTSPRVPSSPGVGHSVIGRGRLTTTFQPVTRIASSSDHEASTSSGSPIPPKVPIPVPKAVSGLLKSLQDFGIGKNSLKEGGVGLFLLGGCACAFALVAWARSNAMRVGVPYQLTVELPVACGITIGTPVRIRGVQVGGRTLGRILECRWVKGSPVPCASGAIRCVGGPCRGLPCASWACSCGSESPGHNPHIRACNVQVDGVASSSDPQSYPRVCPSSPCFRWGRCSTSGRH